MTAACSRGVCTAAFRVHVMLSCWRAHARPQEITACCRPFLFLPCPSFPSGVSAYSFRRWNLNRRARTDGLEAASTAASHTTPTTIHEYVNPQQRSAENQLRVPFLVEVRRMHAFVDHAWHAVLLVLFSSVAAPRRSVLPWSRSRGVTLDASPPRAFSRAPPESLILASLNLHQIISCPRRRASTYTRPRVLWLSLSV